MTKTGGMGVNFLAGEYILKVTRPNGECSQNLVSNPADVTSLTTQWCLNYEKRNYERFVDSRKL